ncbi:MAG: glycosyltransferase family 4 protein [Rhodospirillaceae bacterium]|nr:glycosyltransferase family 4 protein [Rhodospirillaceae bacterium]
MKQALLITRNLPPLVGGMERLIWHIAGALAQEYRLHVIGPKGAAEPLPQSITVSEIPIKPIWVFLLLAKWSALYQAVKRRPALVFAGSGLTAPFAWLAARLTGAKCAVYLHGLDVEARHPVYRWLWRPLFKRFDLVLVNSRFTRALALEAGVQEAHIRILHPGVTLPSLDTAEQQRAVFRQHYQLGDSPVLLYVGRITARKGLLPFVRDILPSILTNRPDAQLVVIGDEPRMALRQEISQCAQIRQTLEEKGLSGHVTFVGELQQDDPLLSQAYFAADVLVFPVQDSPGDNEGFGMVAVEAAAHGLPTVAFDVGGVGDAVADGLSGRLVSAGCAIEFAEAVLAVIERRDTALPTRAFAQQFAWVLFNQRLQETLWELE